MKPVLLSVSTALLTLTIAVPTIAKTHKDTYPIACSALWPAIKDTLRNSGKYGIISITNDEMTASYNIGGTLTGKRVNTVLPNTIPTGCEMQIQTSYSGLVNNDASDFKGRVDASLTKLKAAGPASDSKPDAKADEKPDTKPDTPPAQPAPNN